MAWTPPPTTHRDELRLVPLTQALVHLDTQAYRSSPVAIAAHSAGRWPDAAGFTVEQNRPLVAGHEAEHEAGEAFAYAVLDGAGTRELGCAYLRPLAAFLQRSGTRLDEAPGQSAVLTYWLVDDAAVRPVDALALEAMRRWVADWGQAPCVLRLLHEERGHAAAAQALALPELAASGQTLPYRWFRLV